MSERPYTESLRLTGILTKQIVLDAIRARETSRYTIRYTASSDAQFGQRYLPVEVEVTLQKTSGRDETGYYAPSQ